MHCDTISRIWGAGKEGRQISLRNNDLHIDLEKMRQGDYLLQNFAMFVYLEEEKDPLTDVLEMADVYERVLKENQDLIAPVFRYSDIEKNQKAGKMSALLTVEEGAAVKGNPAILRALYRLGVRMLTLTWNFENEIGFPGASVNWPDYDPAKNYGLKPAGIEIVQEMNRLGMIVDVSHLSDDGFWDVVKYTDRPFVASHSNSRSICGHARNLTDEMIRALAERGGVTGLNFYGAFLDQNQKSSVEAMLAHIRHIISVGGIGCLGLGTDFDGIDGELELKNASYLSVLADALHKDGFTEDEIEAIFHKNVLRVYKEILS